MPKILAEIGHRSGQAEVADLDSAFHKGLNFDTVAQAELDRLVAEGRNDEAADYKAGLQSLKAQLAKQERDEANELVRVEAAIAKDRDASEAHRARLSELEAEQRRAHKVGDSEALRAANVAWDAEQKAWRDLEKFTMPEVNRVGDVEIDFQKVREGFGDG
ncbi:MAG: hypothetical protein ACR2OR_08915 [Hyphomicrobiales bacterium]